MSKKYIKLRPIAEENRLENNRQIFKQELKDVAKLIADNNFRRMDYLKMFNSQAADKLSKLI